MSESAARARCRGASGGESAPRPRNWATWRGAAENRIRAKVPGGKHDSGMIVATPREKTREQIERAELIASITESVAAVLQEIERGRASVRTIEMPPSTLPPDWPKS